MTVDAQLIDLQTRLAFQEDHINELNNVVAEQQREIHALRMGFEELKRQMRSMAPSNVASEAEEAPPPHY